MSVSLTEAIGPSLCPVARKMRIATAREGVRVPLIICEA